MTDHISAKDFLQASGTEDWRLVGSDGATAFFATSSFAQSTRLLQAISELPGVEDRRPRVDVRGDGVTVSLITYEGGYFGMSQRDVELARRITAAARELGLSAHPSAVQSVLVIPGAPDIKAVMPFWQAILGYEPRRDSPEEDLVDTHDRGPGFWFEKMEEPRADGGGAIHLAVWVPIEEAHKRIEAALAAGGRMVRDDFAPAWWTLADQYGNEADIATISHRDGA